MSDDTQPNPYAQFVDKPADPAAQPANPYAQFAQQPAGANPYAQYSYAGADQQPVKQRGALGEIANQLKAGFISDLPKMAGQALQYAVEPGDKLYDIGKSIADYGRAQAQRPDLQPQESTHNFATNALASGARMIPQSIVPAMAVGAAIARPTSALPMVARLGIGSVASSLPAAMSQGQETLDKAHEKGGIPEDQAREAARITAFEEGAGESIGTFALGKLFGIAGRALGKSHAGTAAEQALEGATNTQVLKPWLRQLPETIGVEVGTEMGQNASEAETERRYGIDDHSPWDAAKEAIAPTVGMTLLLAPFGLAGHGIDAGRTKQRNDIFQSPDADQQQRTQVANEIASQIGEVDKTAERNFRANVARAISANEPLPIDGSLFADPSQPRQAPATPAAGSAPANPDDPSAGAAVPENPLTAAAGRSPLRAFPFRNQDLAQKQADALAARDGVPYQVIPHPKQQGKFIAVPVEQSGAQDAAAAAAPLAEAAGVAPQDGAAPPAPVGLQPGEPVQVTINGVDQFENGTQLIDLSDDGQWARVQGSDAAVPVSSLTRIDPAAAAAIDAGAHQAATSDQNDRKPPSEAQQRAGNYKKGEAELQGIPLMVENPVGTTREGTDPDGAPWSTTMSDHYGYIRGTRGADGDAVDTYIGPNPASHHVFVIDQLDQDTGEFDEHKVMLGYNSPEQAQKAYEAHYTQGWQGGENITATTVDGLKKWIKEGDTTAPFNPVYFGGEARPKEVAAPAAPAAKPQGQAATGPIEIPGSVTPEQKKAAGNQVAASPYFIMNGRTYETIDRNSGSGTVWAARATLQPAKRGAGVGGTTQFDFVEHDGQLWMADSKGDRTRLTPVTLADAPTWAGDGKLDPHDAYVLERSLDSYHEGVTGRAADIRKSLLAYQAELRGEHQGDKLMPDDIVYDVSDTPRELQKVGANDPITVVATSQSTGQRGHGTGHTEEEAAAKARMGLWTNLNEQRNKAAAAKPQAEAAPARPGVQAAEHSEIIDVKDFVAKSTPVGKNDAGEALYESERGRFRLRNDRPDRPHGYPDFGGDLSPKRSDQYKRYQTTIERQLSNGQEIPAGVLEQIRADERLDDGEAEDLHDMATGGLRGGPAQKLSAQQLQYKLQNYRKDGRDKDGNQVWRKFDDAGESEVAVDKDGRVVRDHAVTHTFDLDDKRSVEMSVNGLTGQWFATEYDARHNQIKRVLLSDADMQRRDREKMLGEKFGADKVEELDRKVARTPAKAWATRPHARKAPGFNRQDFENDVRAYDWGIVGSKTEPAKLAAHKALGKKLADPGNYVTPAEQRAERIKKLDDEIAKRSAEVAQIEADKKAADEKKQGWQYVTKLKVAREALASARETRDSLAGAQAQTDKAAAEPSTVEKPSLHDQLEALLDEQAHHPERKDSNTVAGNRIFSFKFHTSIPVSQEALDQFVPLKGEQLKARTAKVEKQWEEERARQQAEQDNFPTRGFEHVIKPESSDVQLQLATAKGWGFTEKTVPVRYPGSIDTVFHDFQVGLEYDNGKGGGSSKQIKFRVLVAQGPNGNWTYSTEASIGHAGGGSHPSIWDPQYATREQAITAGAEELRQRNKDREDVLKLIDREYAKLGITGEAKAIAPTGDWPWKDSPFAARIDAALAKLAAHAPDYLRAYRSGFVQDANANRLTEESVAFREKKVDQIVGERTGKATAVPFTPLDAAGMQKVSDVSDALPKEIVDAAIAKWNPVAEQLAQLGYQHGEVFTNAPQAAQALERQLKDIANALMGLAPRRWLVERDKKLDAPKTEKEAKRRAATLRHLERAEDYATEVLGIKTRDYPAVDTANRITLVAGIRKKAGELESSDEEIAESAAPAMQPKGTWQESEFAKRIETMIGQLRGVGNDDMARVVEDDMKTAAGRGLLDEAEVKRKEELTRNILAKVAPKPGQSMVVTKGKDGHPQVDFWRIEFKGVVHADVDLPAPLVARVQNVLRTRPDAYHLSRPYRQNDTRIHLGQEDDRNANSQASMLLLDNGTVEMLGDDSHHWGSTMTQASAVKALNNWLNSLPELDHNPRNLPNGMWGTVENPLKFVSGMSRPGDYSKLFAGHRSVGVMVSELSNRDVDKALAEQMAKSNGYLFVDSGAFPIYKLNERAFAKALEKGFEDFKGEQILTFDQILERYERLDRAISEASDGEANDRAFFVMPDIVGRQEESLRLVGEYARTIKQYGDRAIIPLQSGKLSLTQAYESAMLELARDPDLDDGPVIGIPSAAEAVSNEELTALLKKHGERIAGVHVLGAYSDLRLAPRLKAIREAGYEGNVSADANRLRALMYGDRTRGQAWEELFNQSQPEGGRVDTTEQRKEEASKLVLARWGFTQDTVPANGEFADYETAVTRDNHRNGAEQFAFEINVAQAPNGKWAVAASYTQGGKNGNGIGFGTRGAAPKLVSVAYPSRIKAIEAGADAIRADLLQTHGDITRLAAPLHAAVKEAAQAGKAQAKPAAEQKRVVKGFATMEQEASRVEQLQAIARLQARPLGKENANGRKSITKDIKAAQAALAKLPEGRLTQAGAAALPAQNPFESRAYKEMLRVAQERIQHMFPSDLEMVYTSYSESYKGEQPLTKQMFKQLLQEQASQTGTKPTGWLGALTAADRATVDAAMATLREQSNADLHAYQQQAPKKGEVPAGSAHVDAHIRGLGLASLLHQINLGKSVTEAVKYAGNVPTNVLAARKQEKYAVRRDPAPFFQYLQEAGQKILAAAGESGARAEQQANDKVALRAELDEKLLGLMFRAHKAGDKRLSDEISSLNRGVAKDDERLTRSWVDDVVAGRESEVDRAERRAASQNAPDAAGKQAEAKPAAEPVAAPAPKPAPTIEFSDDHLFDAEFQDALGHLGDVLGDVFGGKLNITGQKYTAGDLLPALSKVIEMLVRKGVRSFSKAVATAARGMRANDKTAPFVDQISPRQWKAAYNAIAEMHEGTDTEAAVNAVSNDEVARLVAPPAPVTAEGIDMLGKRIGEIEARLSTLRTLRERAESTGNAWVYDEKIAEHEKELQEFRDARERAMLAQGKAEPSIEQRVDDLPNDKVYALHEALNLYTGRSYTIEKMRERIKAQPADEIQRGFDALKAAQDWRESIGRAGAPYGLVLVDYHPGIMGANLALRDDPQAPFAQVNLMGDAKHYEVRYRGISAWDARNSDLDAMLKEAAEVLREFEDPSVSKEQREANDLARYKENQRRGEAERKERGERLANDKAGKAGTSAKEQPKKPGKVYGQAKLRLDYGVPAIDGYTETKEFPHGPPGDIPSGGVKDAFLKDAQRYLKDVTGMLLDAGFTNAERFGKAIKPVSVNRAGPAAGGDAYLTMFHEQAQRGIYIHVGTGGFGGVSGSKSGISLMMRVTEAKDPFGGGENLWMPADLTAAALAERARKAVFAASPNRDTLNATDKQGEDHGPDDAGDDGTQALGGVPAGENGGTESAGDAGLGDPGRRPAGAGRDPGLDGAGVSGARGGRGGAAATDPAAAGAGSGQRGGKGRGRSGKAVPGHDAGSTGAPGRVSPAPANVPAVNFRINPDLRLGQGSETVKFNDNLDAIRTLKQVERDNRRATPEEQAILARYVGWGGLKNAFPDPLTGQFKPEWAARGEELASLLTDKEHAAASRSTLDAHYTSEKVVQAMWKAAEHLGFKGGITLESSMGVGNFFGLVPEQLAPQTKFVGVEYDAITARIAALLYPRETVLHSGFQKVPLPDSAFDLAIGNPPFGSQSLTFQFKPELNGLSIHNQFFLGAIEAVKPGGLQIQVVSRYLMDAVDPGARQRLAQRARLLGAIRLPDSAFRENARTDVVTDIVFLQRLTPSEEVTMTAALEAARSKPEKNHRAEMERRELAAKVPEWVQTGKVKDPAGGEDMVVNQYYVTHPSMVMGDLGRTGKMHGREEVNVTLPKGADLAGMLDEAIGRLPKGVMSAEVDPIEEMLAAHQAMSDSLRIALAGHEAGSITIDQDGKLQQIIERETARGDYELARRELTPQAPWSPSLLLDNRGRWYRVEAVKDANGKAVKKTVMFEGKEVPTKQNLYERRYFNSEAEVPATLQLGQARFNRLTQMVKLRDLLVKQLNLEAQDAAPKEIEANRKALRAAYDAFVAEHGFISEPSNSGLVANMPDGALVQALEVGYRPALTKAKADRIGEQPRDAKAKPAPILSARVINKYIPPTQAASAADALAITMAERGRADMARIAELLGKPEDEVRTELLNADKPLVFEDPESGIVVPADEYLSGEVRRKLAAAKAANMDKNVAALEAVQPEAWGAENVTVLLGSTWVPPQVYAEFVKHITGADARVSFSKVTNAYSVSTGQAVRANEEQWGSDGITAAGIINELLNSRSIRLTYMDSNGNSHFDEERTKLALLKARAIRNEFNDWVFGDGERRRQLVDLFNDKFNVRVNRQHDGSHLVLPGKVPDAVINMRRHQKNAIWRGISERFMLLDHAVGAGKTYTAIARAMERRRMGLSRKPMIVVPNHMVEQFTNDAYKLYPGAKVLAAGKKDFEKSRRRKLFAKIATGDYDLVIVPHSSFFYIGISPETEERYLQRELDAALEAVAEAEEQAKEDGLDNGRRKPFGVKEAERLVDSITARMEKVRGAARKDRLLTFEQMGVDDMTVDEAHEFKNLFYSSRLTNVKGMGNKTGSQKAFDLYNKVRVLAESPTGTVTFMTGTPISNSAAEMYTMMRYLAADKLREFGLEHFDAWRAQFVSTDAGWEPNETGRLVEVNRLGRTWSNMRSLMDLYYSFTDAVDNDDIKRAYAEDNPGKQFPVPEVEGGGRESVIVQPTPAQIALLEQTIADFDSLPHIQDPYERNKARLRLMDRARKVSLDVRAVDPMNTSDEKDGKLEVLSDRVLEHYKKWDKEKGTQLIFLDRSVPRGKGDDKVLKAYDALLKDQADALREGDEAKLRAISESLEAYDANAMEEMRNAQRGGWNAYQQIKDNLIARGIPASEIRFVQEAETDEAKQALFDAVNDGEVRVLIGSTQRMGAGTNVQQRLVALHHADVTWKPSDIEQREGRIIRQGNLIGFDENGNVRRPGFKVAILAYATERTIDAKMWNLNASKLRTINGIRKYDGAFSMDFADEESVSMAELAALASGDPLLLERVQLASDIDNLELLQRQHARREWGIISQVEDAERTIARHPKRIEALQQDAQLIDDGREQLAEQVAKRSVEMEGATYTSYDEATRALKELVLQQQAGDEDAKISVKIGSKRYQAINTAMDALHAGFGDQLPFQARIDGQDYIARTDAARELAEMASDMMAGMKKGQSDSRVVGTMLGLKVELTVEKPDGFKKETTFATVSLNRPDGSTLVHGSTSTDELKFATNGLRNALSDLDSRADAPALRGSARYYQEQLNQARENLPGLQAKRGQPFPQQEELDTKMARLEEVIRELANGTSDTRRAAAMQFNLVPSPAEIAVRQQRREDDRLRRRDDKLPDDEDGQARFSRGGRGAGMARDKAEQAARRIMQGWRAAPDLAVVETVDQLPFEAPGDTHGVYLDGKVWIVAGNLADERQLEFVLAHEALGHHGLRVIMAEDEITREMNRLRLINPELAKAAREKVERYENQIDLATATEEALADLAADGRPIRGWDKFVAKVQAALRAVGLGRIADWMEERTQAETMALIGRARAAVVNGRSARPFGEIQAARFSDGQKPRWYSQLARAIERLPQKSATALQWAETIMGSGFAQKGVKQDEIYWTGVLDWLNLQGSANKVSKAALLDYLAANGVRVTETVHEDAPTPTPEGLAKRQAVFEKYNERIGALVNRMLDPDLTFAQHEAAEAEYDELLAARNIEADLAYRLPADTVPQPKYDTYTLPGGDNYRELLLTLPEREPSFRLDDYIGELSDKYGWEVEGNMRRPGWTEADLTADERTQLARLQADEALERQQRARRTFQSSHWGEKNVLAHIRFNDRIDAEGNRVLHVEELQSDWGQVGKREGFIGTTQEDAKAFFGISDEDWARLDNQDRESYRQEMLDAKDAVPAAPFVGKTDAWLNLALKRVLTYAAENGYDRVSFVTGQQAVDRFQLSAEVDRIDYWTRSGQTMIAIFPKGEDTAVNLVVVDGVVGKAVHTPEEFVGQRLDRVLGKEMADRILDDPNDGSIEGENLVLGGDGMRTFYDRIVPNAVNGLLKQVGGSRVGTVEIENGTPGYRRTDESGDYLAQPGFDITDAMREKLAGGMPLFKRDGVRLAPNGRPSKLSERQWEQVRTPEFKAWFGDWENNPAAASKVVDENGEPRVVFHGTHADVAAFDKSKIRSPGGFWFSDRRDYIDNVSREDQPGFNQMPVFLNIRKPLDAGRYALARKDMGQFDNTGVQRNLKLMGGDGVRLDNGRDSTWIALEPGQIKSAVSNAGTYDRGNADIRFSRGELPEPSDPGSLRLMRATPQQMANAAARSVKAVTWTRTGNTLAHMRSLGLQFLGRLQLTDVYGKLFPQQQGGDNLMQVYSDLAALMDAEKNEGGTKADEVAKRWAKLKDEEALAKLMHDSTRLEIDPSKPFQYGDIRRHYNDLKQRYDRLTPQAKQVYQDAARMYADQHEAVRRAVHERIARSLPDHPNRASMIRQLEGEFFSRRIKGVYFPLARFGDYVITVRYVGKNPQPGQSVVREAVAFEETLNAAEDRRAELIKQYPPEQGYEVMPIVKRAEYNAARDSVSRGFLKKLFGTLDEAGLQDPSLLDAINQIYLTSLPDLSWAKTGIHRAGMPGFSQDARRAFAHHMFHGANYLAKLNYSDQLAETLESMQKHVLEKNTDASYDRVKAQQVVDEMVKRHDAYMNPKASPLSTKLTGLGFLFYLGLSPASAMVNLLQTPTVAFPLLGGRFGYKKASSELLTASKAVMRGHNRLEGQLTGDEKLAYDEWVRTGLIDLTMVHDLAGIASGRDSVWRGHMRGYMEKAAWMFHHAELFNRQATALATYRLARQSGMNHEAAYRASVDITKASHFDYSAGNRPRFMQGPIAQVIFLFKQYAQNLMYTFARNAYLMTKGDKQARNAFLGLLATHTMAAGVLGLPAVSTLLAAASMLGGSDDDPWDAQVALRRALADMFSEAFGDEVGQKLGEVLSHGVSRLTPWDISGRVGADHLIVPDVQESLQGADAYNAYLAGLLGPVVGMGASWAKSFEMIVRGDVGRGIENMLPAFLKGPVRSMRYATEGGAKDRNGITLVEDISEAEHAGSWLGFSAGRVREAQEAKSAVYAQDVTLQHRRQVLMNKFADAVIGQDDGDREQALAAIVAFNEKHPNRLIAPLHLQMSVRNRMMRRAQARDGLYLPGKRGLDARQYGDFANGEGGD
jgi:N12 class adenine-specific DNA methylase